MKAPLTIPASGAALQEFEIQRIDYSAPEASGAVGGVQAGWPKWLAVWTIGKVGQDKSDELRAFVSECRGQMRTFYAADLARRFPKAYRDFTRTTKPDGTAFTGAASSWSQSIDSSDDQLLTLNGLPKGLVLSTLDYIGFKWDDADFAAGNLQRRALARVIRGGGGNANSSGQITVKVEPPLHPLIPPSAIAHLDNPCCTMRLVGQTRLDAVDRRLAIKGGTIVAIQDLRA